MAAIEWHKASKLYKTAVVANEYYKKCNVEILSYVKYLYNSAGMKYRDLISANNKLCSGFFPMFVDQLNQYLLGNGVTFKNSSTKEKLGEDFDDDLQTVGLYALLHGSGFGFVSDKKIQPLPIAWGCQGFMPLYDEQTGQLSAGVRFWQLDEYKPMNITLFEPDGYTEFINVNGTAVLKTEKHSYITRTRSSAAFGVIDVIGENYSRLPIVEMKANEFGISELVGIKTGIDAYDRVKSGLINDIDDNAMIYWILQNTGGMGDKDLARFRERVKTTGVATVDGDDGVKAEMFTKDIPHEARSVTLQSLEDGLYRDFGVVNVKTLTGGNKTATEIKAAYEPQDKKADKFEYQVRKFIQGVLDVYGIKDTPKFKRSRITNDTEETQRLMLLADILDRRTLLSMLPGIDPEEIDTIMQRKELENQSSYTAFEPSEDAMGGAR